MSSDVLPVYAVCDRPVGEGGYKDPNATQQRRLRILGEYREASHALEAAKLLRWAGSAAEVVLITQVRPGAVDG